VRVPVLGDFVSDASGIYHPVCADLADLPPLGGRFLDRVAGVLSALVR